MIEDRLDAAEAFASLRRGLLQPEGVPLRVATSAAIAVAAPGSATERELRWWREEPAEGHMVSRLAAVAEAAAAGRCSEAAAVILERYGESGIAAAVGFAALSRMEGREAPRLVDRYGLAPPPRERDAVDVMSSIRRAFGEIPVPWSRVGHQLGAIRRWWTLHETVMRPGALSGEEKWLAAVAAFRAIGADRAAIPYERLLEEWTPDADEREAAVRGDLTRLRRGFRRAQRAAGALTAGAIDRDRGRLATAGLTDAEESEYLDVVTFVRGLSTYGIL